MSVATPVLTVFIPGTPRPKGSLKPISRRGQATRLVEDNPHSKPWRAKMAKHMRKAWEDAGHTLPLNEPVEVVGVFRFERPAEPMFEVPATRDTGDGDKLLRNVYDALEDAGVIADDSRVADGRHKCRYEIPNFPPGALIVVMTGIEP